MESPQGCPLGCLRGGRPEYPVVYKASFQLCSTFSDCDASQTDRAGDFEKKLGTGKPELPAWLVASGNWGNVPRGPGNLLKNPVFGRPKIIKNLTFKLSDPTSGPGIGTGMAENPPYLILSSGG